MFSNDRNAYRKVFFEAWEKHKTSQLLEPLQAQLVEIILMHPEYQNMLDHPEQYEAKDFDASNPFLHMSLHLGIREQVSTNRPMGIKEIYLALAEKYQDIHTAEHKMMEYLAETLWNAEKTQTMPNETEYLNGLKNL